MSFPLQNVPTLGVSALNLASYLCDEVSLAGFGYNLSQKDAPLHYYDHSLMTAMLKESTHDVQTETVFLKRLVASGSITDLTGGIHCDFCSRWLCSAEGPTLTAARVRKNSQYLKTITDTNNEDFTMFKAVMLMLWRFYFK